MIVITKNKGEITMIYLNELEGEIAYLESELRTAELNDWEFEIAVLKDEIAEKEMELKRLEG